MPQNPGFPIRTVCALTGIKPVTLRTWERRYGLFEPARTPTGHRFYTDREVEQIRRVLDLVKQGVPIGDVRHRIGAEVQPRRAEDANSPWRDVFERMVFAVARFDAQQLDRIYDEALSLHAIGEVTRHLLLPLLRLLGDRWAGKAGGIAQEHFFSTYLRSKIGSRLTHHLRYASGPRLVAACAPDEQHEIGLLLFCIEACMAGLRPVVLGAAAPFEEIRFARHQSGAGAIVLSSSIEPSPVLQSKEFSTLVREAGAPVFVGGMNALRYCSAVTAAGAIPLTCELEDAVRLILPVIAGEQPSPREHS